MQSLEGKVMLVTGAARGLGEVVARLGIQSGARVIIADVSDELGKALASELGDAAAYMHLDVRSESEWDETIRSISDTFGALHVLVNDAAILRVGSLEHFSVADFMAQVEVNQLGAFLGMRAVVPIMRAQSGGSIVNIGSVDAIHGMGGVLAYSGTKWALRGMTKVAAQELGPFNIRVNAVHPGGIHTQMTEGISIPGLALDPEQIVSRWALNRSADLEEVAKVVLFMASDDSSYCTGADISCDGGSTIGPRYA